VHFSSNLRHPTVSFFGTPRNYINLYSSLLFHFKLSQLNKRKTKVHLRYLPIPEHSGLRVMSSMAVSPRKRMPLFPMNWIVYLYIWIALLVQKGRRRIGEDETKANLAWQRQSALAHTQQRPQGIHWRHKPPNNLYLATCVRLTIFQFLRIRNAKSTSFWLAEEWRQHDATCRQGFVAILAIRQSICYRDRSADPPRQRAPPSHRYEVRTNGKRNESSSPIKRKL